MSYSWGTYLPDGTIGNYWRDFSKQQDGGLTEIMFKTGDGEHWFVLKLTDIFHRYEAIDPVAMSGNFAGNTKVFVSYNPTEVETPWINVGGSHSGAYMMWGENGSNDAKTYDNGWHITFKNVHGGILAFVR
mgnify:CR=1 FL=1